MSRKRIERNIAYDDVRDIYYVTFHYGIGEDGEKVTKIYFLLPNCHLTKKRNSCNLCLGTLVT